MATKVVRYRADDGTEFDSKRDAEIYPLVRKEIGRIPLDEMCDATAARALVNAFNIRAKQ